MDNENANITAKKQQIGKPFEKGKSGNPNGRPKGSAYMEQLRAAIKEVEKKKKKKFFVRVMERAWTSDSVMVAVLKKFVPDTMRQEIEGLENVQIIIKRADDNK